MAQNKWQMPATTSDDVGVSILTWIPNALNNLRELHGGTLDPATPANNIGSAKNMLWADEGNSLLKMRNVGDTAWMVAGTLADNLGHLRIDGSNALTANLDFGGFVPKGVASFAATAGPTHTSGDKWFEIKDTGGNSFYFHCQQTKP